MTVAHPGPQSGLRQTRQPATTEHACCQFYTSLPSRQQSDVSDNVTLSKLCAVASDYNLQSAEVQLTPSDTLDLMTLFDVSLIHTCGCIWLSISRRRTCREKRCILSNVAMFSQHMQGDAARQNKGRLCAASSHTYALAALGNTADSSVAVKVPINTLSAQFYAGSRLSTENNKCMHSFWDERLVWSGSQVVSPLSYKPDCRFGSCRKLAH